MLMVARHPVIDLSAFAADGSLYDQLRSAPTWTAGEFIPGIGQVKRRPAGVLRDWPSERVYVDFRRAARFPSRTVEAINKEIDPLFVDAIHRRFWTAFPDVECLFDFDFVIPFGIQPKLRQTHSLPPGTSLRFIMNAVESVVGQKCIVGIGGREWGNQRRNLLYSGNNLSELYAYSTVPASLQIQHSVNVYSGAPVVAIEAPGLKPTLDIRDRINRYEVNSSHLHGLEILSFEYLTFKRGRFHCYLISSPENSIETRRAIRAIRVHLLRLHSVREFISRLVRLLGRRHYSSDFFAMEGVPHDRLQLVLSEILRTFERAKVPEVGALPNLLSVAFTAHEVLSDASLEVLERQLLAGIRPTLRQRLYRLAKEESARLRVDSVLEHNRDRANVLTISGGIHVTNSKYDQRGSSIGAAGDHSKASQFTQSGASVLQLGSYAVDRFKLVADLALLQQSISKNGDVGDDVKQAQEALEQAETAAREGDGEAVRSSLSRVGEWVSKLAQTVGATVAAAAINQSLGI